MSDTLDRPAATESFPVFIWFGKPDIGPDEMLMVLARDKVQGLVSKPLISTDLEVARQFADTAQAAANALGVTAVLREFEYVAVLDRLDPQP